jgi:PPIC-type PPIASE domain
MRLFVSALVLGWASYATAQTAQTNVVDSSVQGQGVAPQQGVAPRTPIQRSRIRRATPAGMPTSNVKAENVPPTTAVVTLEGICSERTAKGPCKTVITREDLDKFAGAFAPEASEAVRGRMAIQYARALAMASLAEQQGLDKNPAVAKEIEAQLKMVRMRILSSFFMQNLQRQPVITPDVEIQAYYQQHQDQYEQAQVRRLSVPLAVPTENGRPLDREAIRTEMEALRKRAVAGEDLNQLQHDAYKDLHIQATPPPLNVVPLRRSGLQGDERKAFDLKPGEISEVLDSAAVVVFFKLESKEVMPIESIRPEVEAALRGSRTQNQLSKLTKKINAQFNLEYLGMSSQPDLFGLSAVGTTASANPGTKRRAPGTRP